MTLNYHNYWVQKIFLSFLFDAASKFLRCGTVQHRFLHLKITSWHIYPLSLFLKKHSFCLFHSLVDMASYDRPGAEMRFTLVYNLLSVGYNSRAFIFSQIPESTPMVETVSALFAGALWVEREIWDLMGIFFTRHGDLRRILSDYGFAGHPLRKDFPLTGYLEVLYDDSQKQIIYKPVELVQDFRGYIFKNTWK